MLHKLNLNSFKGLILGIIALTFIGCNDATNSYQRSPASARVKRATLSVQQEAFIQSFKETKEKAEQGNAQAQLRLSEMYFLGQGVEKNIEKFEEWFNTSAENIDLQAHEDINRQDQSLSIIRDNIERNLDNAVTQINATRTFEKIKDLAKRGNAQAQLRLSHMYSFGQGTKENIKKAVAWSARAKANREAQLKAKVSELLKLAIKDGNAKLAERGYLSNNIENNVNKITQKMRKVASDTRSLRQATKSMRKAINSGLTEKDSNLKTGNHYKNNIFNELEAEQVRVSIIQPQESIFAPTVNTAKKPEDAILAPTINTNKKPEGTILPPVKSSFEAKADQGVEVKKALHKATESMDNAIQSEMTEQSNQLGNIGQAAKKLLNRFNLQQDAGSDSSRPPLPPAGREATMLIPGEVTAPTIDGIKVTTGPVSTTEEINRLESEIIKFETHKSETVQKRTDDEFTTEQLDRMNEYDNKGIEVRKNRIKELRSNGGLDN